ncbi:AMP-binding protein [Vibrio fluvialis]|nr:AMP-binding protein [Vibrio fluvialis]MBY8103960.1 AMP-binding protein [Vibrio fluvialis]
MIFLPNNISEYEGTIAIVDENNNHVSYGELARDVSSFASQFKAHKKLVFLLCANQYQTVVSYLACLDSQCPVLLLDSKIEDELLNVLLDTYNPNVIINATGEIVIRHEVQLDIADDIALLMTTSGTTGSPKLVKLSEDNLKSNALAISEYLAITRDDCAITSLPFSYSYGLSVINSYLASTAKIVLTDDSLLSKDFWNKIKEHKVTSFAGVPYTFEMLKKLKYARFDTSSIRYVTQAGGRLDTETKRYMLSECLSKGQEFVVMYGQTEASPRISYVPFSKLENKIDSIGVAVPNGELFLLDSDGQYIECAGIEGEIFYRGPNVMLGYASNQQELASVEGAPTQLATGDLGYFDKDGFFYITGRTKRFIKIFGLRIGLDELEHWLRSSGYHAISTGEDNLLLVFTDDSGVDLDALKKVVSQKFGININYIKALFVDSYPRFSSGKINYKALIENYHSC